MAHWLQIFQLQLKFDVLQFDWFCVLHIGIFDLGEFIELSAKFRVVPRALFLLAGVLLKVDIECINTY